MPKSWGQAYALMLFRKGERFDSNNYRRIALMNTISKTWILNKRLTAKNYKQLVQFIKCTGVDIKFRKKIKMMGGAPEILTPEFQFRFREKRSCLVNAFTLNSMIQIYLSKESGKFFAFFVVGILSRVIEKIFHLFTVCPVYTNLILFIYCFLYKDGLFIYLWLFSIVRA